MPNVTVDSPLLAIAKAIVALLAPSERSRLRVWLLAKFDVRGYDAIRMPE